MELDDHVCLCFRVSQRKLLNYIRTQKPRVASQLSQCGGAGTGCGWCVPYLKRLFEQARAAENPAAIPLATVAPAEYAQNRGSYIDSGQGTPPQ
jgi:NAD(P)H-nitrite reductase large subunit